MRILAVEEASCRAVRTQAVVAACQRDIQHFAWEVDHTADIQEDSRSDLVEEVVAWVDSQAVVCLLRHSRLEQARQGFSQLPCIKRLQGTNHNYLPVRNVGGGGAEARVIAPCLRACAASRRSASVPCRSVGLSFLKAYWTLIALFIKN